MLARDGDDAIDDVEVEGEAAPHGAVHAVR